MVGEPSRRKMNMNNNNNNNLPINEEVIKALQVLQESGILNSLQILTQQQMITPQVKKDYSNEELIAWFLDELAIQKSEKTAKAYAIDLQTFTNWSGNMKFTDVTHTEALQYVKYLREYQSPKGKPYAPATINRKHTTMNAFFDFLIKKEVIELRGKDNKNVFQQIDQISTDHLTISHDFLTKEECQLLIETIENSSRCRSPFVVKRNAFMYELMMGTGLRYEEVQRLTADDFDLEARQIDVLGKRNKRRKVPFPKVYHKQFLEYVALRNQINADIDNLFITEVKTNKQGIKTGGKTISHDQSIEMIERYLEEAGIELNGRRITNHSLRHTYATLQIDAGCSTSKLSKRMGHTNPSFTQEHYVHVVSTDEDDRIAEELAFRKAI